MRAINKRLTIFSKQEQFALYGLPDFNDEQRAEYLTLTESELQLAFSRSILWSGYQNGYEACFRVWRWHENG